MKPTDRERNALLTRLIAALEIRRRRKLNDSRRRQPDRFLRQNGWQPGDYWHEFDQRIPDHYERYR